jgi:hypothetical protein
LLQMSLLMRLIKLANYYEISSVVIIVNPVLFLLKIKKIDFRVI